MATVEPTATTKRPAGRTSDIEARVAELRAPGTRSPESARDEAWRWICELQAEAGRDPAAARARLNELFRAGVPPRRIDGQTQGILVQPLIAGPVDSFLRRVTGLWMPWLGKRFHASRDSGDNVLAGSARWPLKLLWPLYATTGIPSGRAAFDFETRVERGKDDPDRDVLVIDYAVVDSNPRFVIKQIRDELVEIVPGANLGKVLWRNRDGSYSLIGFFALLSPAG